ncbi:hypothetical protein DB032_05455 [Chromobacterium sp. Panama]|uniref:2OG-Fe(II) oxygenase n=1 Tax=Chromobacterium sp. Panama TaxID=2161826 RepID=UPI000D2FF877|nr:2OG-Fe(II) oxygenase [Chromobacterium sp. Panama]PTU64391.1 hypothetical protein DB032_05455 [Chromobacterium sp. Panama]
MLENVLFFEQPYRHFLCFDTFDETVAQQADAVLRGPLPWEERVGDFFVTYRLDLRRLYQLRPDAPAFVREEFLDALREQMQILFEVPLSADDIQVLGHRMVPGQRIGVHNDNPGLGYEGYRVVVQFTRDHRPEDGGLLNIHAGDEPEAVYQSIRPYPNMAFGFEMSAHSYHSVSALTRQPRDALIFNFWHQGNTPAVERRVRQTLAQLFPDAALAASDPGERGLHRDGDVSDAPDWPAPSAAQALLAEWGLGGAAQAAGLLLTAARSGGPEPVRAPEVSAALARLGFAPGAPLPASEAIHAAAQVNVGLSTDPDTLRAALVLAVWVASAPSRMFTHEHWRRCAAQVRPWAHRLPIRVMHLAETLFPEWPQTGAG